MKQPTPVLDNSKGSVLIITLLVLMVGSLIAIYATNTSTVETRVATNEKSYTTTFYAADAGVDPGVSVLLDIFNNRVVASSYGSLQWLTGTTTDNLLNVVMGITTETNRGFSFPTGPSGTATTRVTYERKGASTKGTGSSAEFAAGAEGTGYGSSSGVVVYYYIRPTAAQDTSGSNVTIETLYRKVSGVGEGK